MIKKYEFVALFSPELTEQDIQVVQEQILKLVKKHKGKIVSSEAWGKKVLAYSINKINEAYYLFYVLELDSGVVQAFEQDIRLSTQAMRHLLVIQDAKSQVPKESVVLTENVE